MHYLNDMIPEPARATITAKGQVTLRRSLLDHVGVRPGDRVEFVPLEGGKLEVRPVSGIDISSIFGTLKRPGQPVVTIREMNETIAKGWAGDIDLHDAPE